MEGIDLEQEWNNLMIASGISVGAARTAFQDVCRAYGEPHRHYHTLDHIAQMLLWLKGAGVRDSAGLWAVWYHDYFYRPGKKDNEARSAQQAELVMKGFDINEVVVCKAVAIINATKNHVVETEVDETFLAVLDADMAILGVSEERYKDYCQSVKKEFSSVPDFLYKRGRKGFLREVLGLERIFSTNWFAEHFEKRARSNIGDELDSL